MYQYEQYSSSDVLTPSTFFFYFRKLTSYSASFNAVDWKDQDISVWGADHDNNHELHLDLGNETLGLNDQKNNFNP